MLYCTVLYCTVLYCTALYCTALYYTVLYCTVLHCTVLLGPCDEAPSVCARLLILSSVLLVLLTLPFSLCCVIKVVQVSAVLAMTVDMEMETV